ncbi:hypothetical protein LCGC14_1240440 [marine sediment metagenome]|uniref:Uncharacterized protein n=1 Tax=marine sediment metagenome TaxID=412755 RepID=A0A0F9LT84_9ZZZZ
MLFLHIHSKFWREIRVWQKTTSYPNSARDFNKERMKGIVKKSFIKRDKEKTHQTHILDQINFYFFYF